MLYKYENYVFRSPICTVHLRTRAFFNKPEGLKLCNFHSKSWLHTLRTSGALESKDLCVRPPCSCFQRLNLQRPYPATHVQNMNRIDMLSNV